MLGWVLRIHLVNGSVYTYVAMCVYAPQIIRRIMNRILVVFSRKAKTYLR